MKTTILAPISVMLFISSCVETPPPVTTTTTTTEVRREVVTTAPGTVTREVIVTRRPPAVRIETRTVAPGTNYVWTSGYWRWTGSAPDCPRLAATPGRICADEG